mmetsp:Transcript_43305/g.143252  ORF Transcript_43305/g.143252 Transcript_43305/m.143252 type:complete len:221 (-) Transcript_43305:194-856(-)
MRKLFVFGGGQPKWHCSGPPRSDSHSASRASPAGVKGLPPTYRNSPPFIAPARSAAASASRAPSPRRLAWRPRRRSFGHAPSRSASARAVAPASPTSFSPRYSSSNAGRAPPASAAASDSAPSSPTRLRCSERCLSAPPPPPLPVHIANAAIAAPSSSLSASQSVSSAGAAGSAARSAARLPPRSALPPRWIDFSDAGAALVSANPSERTSSSSSAESDA